MPEITMSIVTYNSEEYILSVIDGIVDGMATAGKTASELPDYSIIVVDNASTDNTAKLVLEAQAKYPGIIEWLPRSQNLGFGTGHNRAIPLMKGQYHAVIKPDIVVSNGALLEMMKFMNQNPDVGLLSPRIISPNGDLQYLCKRNPTLADLLLRLVFPNSFRGRQDRFEMRETGYSSVFDLAYAPGCFMFFRTEVYLQIHGFDEKFFLFLEDADITRRVNEVSRAIFYPKVSVIHECQLRHHKKLHLVFVNIRSWVHYWSKWRRRARAKR